MHTMSTCSTPMSADERDPKRKKIRKGTTSCWECKRRKIRCQFRSPSCEVCIGCQRRGTECLSQDYPEHPPQETSGSNVRIEKRLERMEALLETIAEKTVTGPRTTRWRDSNSSQSVSATGYATDSDIHTPCSITTPNSEAAPLLYSAVINYSSQDSRDTETGVSFTIPEISQAISISDQNTCKSVRRKLYETFPSQRDADLIISAGTTTEFLQFFTIPYKNLFEGNLRPASSLSALPSPSSHPVLLARTLLYLAIGIQQLHPSTFDVKQLNLGKSTAEAMTQYLETASEFITGNDRYIDSLEGLECFFLEGSYHVNAGNLRRAWLLFRRAMGLGQLMGLHRGSTEAVKVLDPNSKASPAFMWYRAVYADRFLALLLGLPAGNTDNSIFASEEHLRADYPSGRLERIHCVVTGRIIERNERMTVDGFVMTQNIDSFLQRAAKSMPAKWWLLSDTGAEALEDIMRVLVQILHFNLLVMLHLPYMIRVSPERRYDYSKIACINNSRELLTRYIRFRTLNVMSFCSRGIDFSAFTGCLTLLLAHLDSHRSNNGMDDFLTHQRDCDRAMVENAINIMLKEPRLNTDVLTEQTAAILTCLLAIEADASGDDACSSTDAEKKSRRLRLTIPYFGTVNISCDGIVRSDSLERPRNAQSCTTVDTVSQSPSHQSVASHHTTAFLQGRESFISTPMTIAGSEKLQTTGPQHHQQTESSAGQVHWEHLTPPMNLQTDFFPNVQQYPVGLNAEVEDWALQGVDRAFFENLLRGDGV